MASKPMAMRTGKGKQEDMDPAKQPPGSLLHSLFVVYTESGKTPLSGRDALSRIFEKRLMVPSSHTGRMQERVRKAHRNLELENEAIKRLRKSSYFFEVSRGTFMLCSALEAPDEGDNSKVSGLQEVKDTENGKEVDTEEVMDAQNTSVVLKESEAEALPLASEEPAVLFIEPPPPLPEPVPLPVPVRSSKPQSGLRRPSHANWQAALSVRQAAFTKRYAAYASRHALKGSDLQRDSSFAHGKQGSFRQAGHVEGRNSHRLAAKLASLRLAQSLKQAELARIVQDKEVEGVDSPANHQGLTRLRRVGEGQDMQQWSPTSEPWKNRRCSRRVKESWQCNREAAIGHKLCEHHLYVNYYRKKFAGYKRGQANSKVKDVMLLPEFDSQSKLEDSSPSVRAAPVYSTGLPSSSSGRVSDYVHYFRKQILVLPGSSLPKNFPDVGSDGDELGKKDAYSPKLGSVTAKPPRNRQGKQIMVFAGSDLTTDVLSTHVPVAGSVLERIFMRKQKQLPQTNLNSSGCDIGGRPLIPREVKGSPSKSPPQAQQDSSGKSLYSYLLKYRLAKQQMKKARSHGVSFENDFTRSLPSNFQIGLRSEMSEVTGLLEPSSSFRLPPSRPTHNPRVVEAPKCKVSPGPSTDLRQIGRTQDSEMAGVQPGDGERRPPNSGKDSAMILEEARKSAGRKRFPNGVPKRVFASSEEVTMSSECDVSTLRNVRKHGRKTSSPRSLDEQAVKRLERGAGFENFSFPKGLMDYLKLKKGHGGSQVSAVPKFADGDRRVKARIKNVGTAIAQCSNLFGDQQVTLGGSERVKTVDDFPCPSNVLKHDTGVPKEKNPWHEDGIFITEEVNINAVPAMACQTSINAEIAVAFQTDIKTETAKVVLADEVPHADVQADVPESWDICHAQIPDISKEVDVNIDTAQQLPCVAGQADMTVTKTQPSSSLSLWTLWDCGQESVSGQGRVVSSKTNGQKSLEDTIRGWQERSTVREEPLKYPMNVSNIQAAFRKGMQPVTNSASVLAVHKLHCQSSEGSFTLSKVLPGKHMLHAQPGWQNETDVSKGYTCAFLPSSSHVSFQVDSGYAGHGGEFPYVKQGGPSVKRSVFDCTSLGLNLRGHHNSSSERGSDSSSLTHLSSFGNDGACSSDGGSLTLFGALRKSSVGVLRDTSPKGPGLNLLIREQHSARVAEAAEAAHCDLSLQTRSHSLAEASECDLSLQTRSHSHTFVEAPAANGRKMYDFGLGPLYAGQVKDKHKVGTGPPEEVIVLDDDDLVETTHYCDDGTRRSNGSDPWAFHTHSSMSKTLTARETSVSQSSLLSRMSLQAFDQQSGCATTSFVPNSQNYKDSRQRLDRLIVGEQGDGEDDMEADLGLRLSASSQIVKRDSRFMHFGYTNTDTRPFKLLKSSRDF